MSDTTVLILIVLGLVVIAVSAGFIIRFLKQEQAQKAALKEFEERQAAETERHRNYLNDSVRIIANAILHDEKLSLTEGCIRLKVMLDNIDPGLHQNPDFEVIEEVYNRTSHIPYLEAWHQLDRKQQRVFEKEMRTVERECEQRVQSAARKLLELPFARVH